MLFRVRDYSAELTFLQKFDGTSWSQHPENLLNTGQCRTRQSDVSIYTWSNVDHYTLPSSIV
jgi:hypothetical protein